MTTVGSLAGRATLVAIFVLGLAVAAPAQPSATLSEKAPDAAAIVAIAEQRGFARVIVEFASPVPPAEMRPDPAFLASIKARIAATQNAIIATHFGSASNPSAGKGFVRGLRRFDITPGFAVNVDKAELEALAADPRVLRIYYDRLLSPTLVQSVPLIGMTGPTGAYAMGATGIGQAIAILDTGVQSNHELLDGNLPGSKVVLQACFSNGGITGVSLCPNGQSIQIPPPLGPWADATTAQCINGNINLCAHGTHVAGIAAGNNRSFSPGDPANGVAKDAKIVAVQVFTRFISATDCNGTPPCLGAWPSDVIAALNWVYTDVIGLNLLGTVKLAAVNMSLGGSLSSTTCDNTDPLFTPIDILRNAGVATIIASGNNGSTTSVSAPSCISIAVTVGSSDKQDVISSFSNIASMVHLLAPGSGILSSVAPTISFVTATYEFHDGTSMAAPHVAGCFAVIRSKVNLPMTSAGAVQIENALKNSGIPITDNRPGTPPTKIIKPRISCNSAINLITPPTPPNPPPHQYRFQYVAKFVCGPNPPMAKPGIPDSRIALGDYRTIINVHNPNNETISFRHKVALADLNTDGSISGFSNNNIGADAAQAFDCSLLQLVPSSSPLIGVIDGFFVIESDLPLDVIGYYTADRNSTAIHVEKSRERDMSRNPLCQKNVQADLSVASNWLRSDGNPAVSVPPFITPNLPIASWDSNRLWMSYGPLYNAAPPGNYSYEFKFCSCSQSSVTVSGTLKSDDGAAASLNSLLVTTVSPSFSLNSPAAPMAGTITFVGPGSLVVLGTNGPGPTGVSVQGTLTLADGYIGACRN